MNEVFIIEMYFTTLVFMIGACIGSFLNVVIYRLPAGQSVVKPRSHCKCGKPIAAYDNIPILSWFILRGRCRHCKERFSFRYPLVELSTALVFVGLWNINPPGPAIAWMVFAAMMIPAGLIDLDTMEIPDRFSIGGFIIGMVVCLVIPAIHRIEPSGLQVLDAIKGAVAGLQGAFIGSGLVLWVALVAEVILKKEAMGFGDVKLMGAIGVFCGWQGAVFAFFGGAVIGCLLLLICLPWIRRMDREDGLRIPFGPSLVLGALFYLLFAEPYVSAYFADIQSTLYSF